jgi:hypothetical protein
MAVYEPRGSKDCDIYYGIPEDEVGSAPIPYPLHFPDETFASKKAKAPPEKTTQQINPSVLYAASGVSSMGGSSCESQYSMPII